MRLTHVFLGILMMVVVSISLLTVATNMGQEYNTTYTDDFTDIQNNLTSYNDELNELIGQDIANKAPGGADSSDIEDTGDFEGGIIKSSWKALTEVPGLFNVFKKLVMLLSEKMKIPSLFYTAAFVSLIIVISFILISSILRNRL